MSRLDSVELKLNQINACVHQLNRKFGKLEAAIESSGLLLYNTGSGSAEKQREARWITKCNEADDAELELKLLKLDEKLSTELERHSPLCVNNRESDKVAISRDSNEYSVIADDSFLAPNKAKNVASQRQEALYATPQFDDYKPNMDEKLSKLESRVSDDVYCKNCGSLINGNEEKKAPANVDVTIDCTKASKNIENKIDETPVLLPATLSGSGKESIEVRETQVVQTVRKPANHIHRVDWLDDADSIQSKASSGSVKHNESAVDVGIAESSSKPGDFVDTSLQSEYETVRKTLRDVELPPDQTFDRSERERRTNVYKTSYSVIAKSADFVETNLRIVQLVRQAELAETEFDKSVMESFLTVNAAHVNFLNEQVQEDADFNAAVAAAAKVNFLHKKSHQASNALQNGLRTAKSKVSHRLKRMKKARSVSTLAIDEAGVGNQDDKIDSNWKVIESPIPATRRSYSEGTRHKHKT